MKNNMRILELTESTRKNILENLLKRSPSQYGQYEAAVNDIITQIRERGDEALLEYTERFDHCTLTPDTLEVTEEVIRQAYGALTPEFIEVLKKSAANIRAYHEKQLRNSWFDTKENGTILGQKITPLQRVGVYVPGGTAAYPSSVLMNIIPAKVAGVKEIVMTTPPGRDGSMNPATLVAADIAGAAKIYKAAGLRRLPRLPLVRRQFRRSIKLRGRVIFL